MRRMSRWIFLRIHFVAFVALLTTSSPATAIPVDIDELLSMDIEMLLNQEISLVNRKLQTIKNSAAAVHVITQEDIKRSGATKLPDLFRLVPGMYSVQMTGNKYVVSSRGIISAQENRMNDLLVLIDGRSIYSPNFGGVLWELQDIVLEDIERIEIIRGPGSTVWGSNAVNGIINIITFSAADTQGSLLSIGNGNVEQGFVTGRHGGKIYQNAYYRLYAKGFRRSGSYFTPTQSEDHDEYNMGKAGFRIDWKKTPWEQVTLIGDVYSGREEEKWFIVTPSSPEEWNYEPRGNDEIEDHVDVAGGNFLGRWQHETENGSEVSLQFYVDHSQMEKEIFTDKITTFDIEFNNHLPWQLDIPFLREQEISWGIGYRHYTDHTDGSFRRSYTPEDLNFEIASAYLQDEISLIPDILTVTLGTKLEYNTYTHFEPLPGIRLLWNISSRQSAWGAITRSSRIPARRDRDEINMYGWWGAWVTGSDNKDIGNENVLAYEMGYRLFPTSHFSIDTAGFYNDFSELMTITQGELPVCMPSGEPTGPGGTCGPGETLVALDHVERTNSTEAKTYGLEVVIDWHPTKEFQLQATYSYLYVNITHVDQTRPDVFNMEAFYEGLNPRHQCSLFSSVELYEDVTLSAWIRYTDQTEFVNTLRGYTIKVEDYFDFDLAFAWQATPNMEFTIVGQGLSRPHHNEYVQELDNEKRRSIYGKVTLTY